ncbi:Bug family tripartite tricarboxylate transporter substrate binding protein [Hydrogenophaga electricum]|uniref:ABC transporter substrate-binding protein n=1 Tax=Hydrogenophaga electricum TaxID=1230953 RepID=A0ABQ6C4R9_9BURK|nr:tripartite tricarboxylate transporter substrate binding protein [Hydrogenophaga electricum]GLS13979.1 ABC transporter substrate-binding protein [Hydrogenophaga electricum]
MDRLTTRRAFASLAAGLALTSTSLVQAQDTGGFPSQPLRIVVGFPAGGPTDVSARLIAESLTRSLGQPVIVDNKPGANATLAADIVARAKPDGYTILMAATNHPINASLYKNLKFDSEKSFAPITAVAVAPTVLVVNPKFPAKTYAEFIALVKSSPGKYTYASAGNGGTPHLSAEMFKGLTGTSIVHIPYRGAAPAVTDLMGGQVDMSFATLGSVLPLLQSGQLRAIAVAAPQRSRLLPDVPTFEESGLKNFRLDSWYGLMAPAGTPKPVIDRLYTDIVKAVTQTAYQQKLNAAGLEPVTTSNPTQFTEQLRHEISTYGALVRANNVVLD